MLLLFNTSTEPLEANVLVEVASEKFRTLAGRCPVRAAAPGSVRVELEPLSFSVCAAE